ncbi:hypothetical protein TRFO_31165 [Tritrichomonas foetus]|uniref:TATA-binding protein interacting (TIP20) domain-containing protein n=1 Tax=Tritrichomonas foetus TaxID=1144522 RepID=A0A1J4JS33_9EUKA|nr:hypothetical protein TRFO_31165 [Tritrichomonas foetus]|eukprot:OHT01921.1 hypothetical protein TRFO_31165 [Tritrichomonas foetus]
MTNQFSENWTRTQFNRDFHNADQDYVVIALRNLLEHLEKVEIFEEEEDYLKTVFINEITSRLCDKMADIVGLVFKIIVSLTVKLPLKIVPYLFEAVFQIVSKQDIEFRTQLLAVFEEAISCAVDCPTERQKVITEYLVPKLTQYIRAPMFPEILVFSLDLLTTTVETLPNSLDERRIDDLENIIKELAKKSNSAQSDTLESTIQSLATLAKVWSTLVNNDKFEKFLEFLDQLDNKDAALSIVCGIIIHRPQLFTPERRSKYADQVFEHLNNDSPNGNADYENENEDNFEEISLSYVNHTTEYLNTLTSLVNAYGEGMDEEALNPYISQAFYFLTFGAQTDNLGNNEENEIEADVDFDSDIEAPDSEGDVEVVASDGSWKIRKAAMALSTSLINEQPDLFYESLIYVDAECDNPSLIDVLIKDSDEGAQTDAMALLKVVIHAYRSKIDSKIVDNWTNSLISQILPGKIRNVPLFIDTLTYIISELRKMPLIETTLHAIECIKRVFAESPTTTEYPTFSFISSLLQYADNANIVKPVVSLIREAHKDSNSQAIPASLVIVSKVYLFYRRESQKKSKEISQDKGIAKVLDELNTSVLSISEFGGERTVYAIPSLAVFTVCCASLPSVGKSVEKIVRFFDNQAAVKSAAAAIALISASESAKQLSSFASELLTKLHQNLTNVDSSVIYRCLWAIRLMLHKKLIHSADCQPLIPQLIDIVSTGDNNARLLSLKVLIRINPNGCNAKSLLNFEASLTSLHLSEEVVFAIAELVETSAKSLDKVKPLVDALIKKGNLLKESNMISNVSTIVGVAGGSNNDYGRSLVSSFAKEIESSNQRFALRCIGEIGSFLDLSKDTALVDRIFQLVKSSDRETFTSAAECVGLMTVGSPSSLLSKLIKNATECDLKSHVTPWLFAISALVKKINNRKGKVLKEFAGSISQISNFLLENADEQKETAQIVAQCLAGLVGINKEYADTLIKKALPVTIRALTFYFEQFADKKTILAILPKISQVYDSSKPLLCESILSCVKVALVNKKLAHKVMDQFQMCLKSLELQPSHMVTQHYGTTMQTVDIGKGLRSSAVDCLSLFFRHASDMFEVRDLLEALLYTLENETAVDVTSKALTLLTEMASSPHGSTLMKESIVEITEVMKPLEVRIFTMVPPQPELQATLIKLVVALRVATKKAKDKKLEAIYAKHRNHEMAQKIEAQYAFSAVDSFSNIVSFQPGYASLTLMEELHPEAASIFAN